MQYDFTIIGNESVDAAAGYYAHRAGLNVLMTDAYRPPHQEGSHHGSGRPIRHAYNEGGRYVPLVLRAQQLWGELAEISGEAVFERTSVINPSPASSSFLANVAASVRAFDLEAEELDAQAVTQRWPETHLPDDYRAIFEPTSGMLRSELAVKTWICLAQEVGCAQLFNCPVSAIHHHADGVTIDTLSGEYHGKKLLVNTDIWVIRLPPDLPIQSVRKASAWFQVDSRYSSEDHFPALIGELPDGDQYYGSPAEDNELKIGKHNGGQPVFTPQGRSALGVVTSDGSESFPFSCNVLPGIGGCLHGTPCIYDNTIDEDLIIDMFLDRPDTLLIAGPSGHSFKFALILGETASQFTQGQTPTFNLTPFSLARFSS